MKRYALFAGQHYYPAGGWEDFRGTFDTPEEAVARYKADEQFGFKQDHDWGQIVDLTTGVVIAINTSSGYTP